MKSLSVVLLLMCLLFFAANTSFSQSLDFGVKAGLNIATIGGDHANDDWKSRTAAAVGGYVIYPVTHSFSVQPELLYSMKGAVEEGTFGGSRITATLKLDYLEIPVLGKLAIPLKDSDVTPVLFAGPSLAFKLSSKVQQKWEDEEWVDDFDDVKGSDVGFTIGGGVGIPVGMHRLEAELRYNFSLSSIDSSGDNLDIKNNVFMLMLSFRLGTLKRL
jgi:hypothetical protein